MSDINSPVRKSPDCSKLGQLSEKLIVYQLDQYNGLDIDSTSSLKN